MEIMELVLFLVRQNVLFLYVLIFVTRHKTFKKNHQCNIFLIRVVH